MALPKAELFFFFFSSFSPPSKNTSLVVMILLLTYTWLMYIDYFKCFERKLQGQATLLLFGFFFSWPVARSKCVVLILLWCFVVLCWTCDISMHSCLCSSERFLPHLVKSPRAQCRSRLVLKSYKFIHLGPLSELIHKWFVVRVYERKITCFKNSSAIILFSWAWMVSFSKSCS